MASKNARLRLWPEERMRNQDNVKSHNILRSSSKIIGSYFVSNSNLMNSIVRIGSTSSIIKGLLFSNSNLMKSFVRIGQLGPLMEILIYVFKQKLWSISLFKLYPIGSCPAPHSILASILTLSPTLCKFSRGSSHNCHL